MKREYMSPTMLVVKLQHRSIICQSQVRSLGGNADLNYGGAGDVNARTKESSSLWDDEW